MKKTTLQTIVSILSKPEIENYVDAAIMDELNAELNKGAEQKAKTAQTYAELYPILFNVLSDTPATVSEIWEAIEDEVPTGMTRSKVQYALTHLWQDVIVKIEGKPNTYARKAA